jgi:hypothetical protein
MPLKTFIHKTILATSGNFVVSKGLPYYVAMLKAGKPFSFSRFGDGEWNAILGVQGENCDGHQYFPELGAKLRASLLKKGDYIYALQPRAIRSQRKGLQEFLLQNHIAWKWHNADVFHDANKQGKLLSLVSCLRSMNVVIIGPAVLRGLKEKVFQYADFIEIPPKNCFLATEDIRKSILQTADKNKKTVYAFSASMATKVLIHELFPLIGADSWLIDFGSLWDIYVGRKSRNVYEKRDWGKIMKKNLGG